MKHITINKHKVEVYDSIEELPIGRFHKFNKYLLIDSGVGSDLNSLHNKINLILLYLNKDINKARIELENMRQAIYLVMEEVNPKHLAFMTLIKSVDGKEVDDMSDEGLRRLQSMFEKSDRNFFDRLFESIKKKIENEFELYFPSRFSDVAVKEYFDRLKGRTLLQLQSIIDGRDRTEDINKIDDFLLTLTKPKIFYGNQNVEINFDKQFEDMCLLLSHELKVTTKEMTVLQYYNSFDYLKKLRKPNGRQPNKI